MKRVLIVESQMNQYRVPFYSQLFTALQARHIELRVAYSDPPPSEAIKNDTCDLPREVGVKVEGCWIWEDRLIYQPLLRHIRNTDLVVVEHANKFVWNHILLALCRLGLRRVAFWGLGENRQEGQIRISEWYRGRTLAWPAWWFAYTESSASYLTRAGICRDRITVVENAIDTTELQSTIAKFTESDLAEARSKIGIGSGDRVGIYCGMLHPVKSLPFLIECAGRIRNTIPNFHLVVVGGGPELQRVEQMAREKPWLHVMGPRFGKEKALLLRLSEVALQPGRVGLVILDCFAAGLPLLTTRIPIHGPEMDYLKEGRNGLTSAANSEEFASLASNLLLDPARLLELRRGSTDSATRYSIENMVSNFCSGICACLEFVPQGTAVRPLRYEKTKPLSESNSGR